MSFIQNETGVVHAPGWFLFDAENSVRETRQIAQTGATTAANGGKYVKAGTAYPSNDENATGIVYEDVDVTSGNMPGSVVTKGTVILDRLPAELDSDAQAALEALGFKFIATTPAVTRPY